MLHSSFRFPLAAVILLACVGVHADDVSPEMPPVLLKMIRDEAVHDELNLSDAQRQRLLGALRTVDGRWFRSRNMPAANQQQEISTLTSELRGGLDDILDHDQSARLAQLERQALGTRMVLRDDVAVALELTTSQRDSLVEAFAETDRHAAETQKKLRDGEQTTESADRMLARLKAAEREQLARTLTESQKSKLATLTGMPFDFGRVRRTYPLAPELTEEGVTWIQGGPVTLEQLRGKVVAVHFYAFQCINCRRNLPHYQAWFDDYSNEDLVIIGIQTPETSSERVAARVAAAAQSEGIKYPVMLDGDALNWKGWSNTMWPTVYLIDKQGFIRRWWQGEMNWKETRGEEQMRRTIEQLLSEDS